ncbi:MAG TPA: hypothetical protein VIK57_22170 [Streptosporangiaceae bacterium]
MAGRFLEHLDFAAARPAGAPDDVLQDAAQAFVRGPPGPARSARVSDPAWSPARASQ